MNKKQGHHKRTISRRAFIKNAAALGALAATNPSGLLSSQSRPSQENFLDPLLGSEFRCGYDPQYFEATERIFFEEYHKGYINLFIKPTQSLDIRLYVAETKDGLYKKNPLHLSGMSDSVDIPLKKIYSPELHYKVEYKDGKSWKSFEERSVKTPSMALESGGTFKVILKGDDHIYADLKHHPEDPGWRKDMLRGDYIFKMLKGIIADPDYLPDIPLHKVIYGFTLAHTLKYIMESKPDLVIDLGDTVGQDSYAIWGELGEWEELMPKDSLIRQNKILWERKRRTINALTPNMAYYQALGNHDGETGWFTDTQPFTQPYAKAQRKRLFRQPEALRMFEKVRLNSGPIDGRYTNDDWVFNNTNQNYFPVFWANGDIRFFLLDVNSYLQTKPRTIYDWTLGPKQRAHIETMLFDGQNAPWKFICYHNAVGGYPLGSGVHPGSYGRGPLLTREDYERINEIDPNMQIDPDKVEQVWLADLAKDAELRGFFYAHDHIYFDKNIGKTNLGKDMIGACVGATIFSGAYFAGKIWENPYWADFYGSIEDDPPKFFTPPGLTEMEIDKNGATIKYVCTAPPEIMFANMPEGTKPGDVLRESWISR